MVLGTRNRPPGWVSSDQRRQDTHPCLGEATMELGSGSPVAAARSGQVSDSVSALRGIIFSFPGFFSFSEQLSPKHCPEVLLSHFPLAECSTAVICGGHA